MVDKLAKYFSFIFELARLVDVEPIMMGPTWRINKPI